MTTEKDLNFYYQRGREKSSSEDLKGAIEDYTKAIEINPNNIEVYWDRGLDRFQLKDYQGVIVDMSKGIELTSDIHIQEHFYFKRAEARELLHEYQKAIKDYTKVIEINPLRNYIPLARRAKVRYKLMDYEGAILDFTNAIEESTPEDTHYLYFYGRALASYDLKNFQNSRDDLTEAIKLIENEYGEYDELPPNIKKVLPNIEKIYKYLGQCCIKLGDIKNALQYLMMASNLGDNEAPSLHKKYCTN